VSCGLRETTAECYSFIVKGFRANGCERLMARIVSAQDPLDRANLLRGRDVGRA